MEVALRGKEGLFLAIVALPVTLSKILSAVLAGPLLSEYCPEDGVKECWKMWVCIGSVSIVPVLLLFFGRKVLEQPDFEMNPYMPLTSEHQEDE